MSRKFKELYEFAKNRMDFLEKFIAAYIFQTKFIEAITSQDWPFSY